MNTITSRPGCFNDDAVTRLSTDYYADRTSPTAHLVAVEGETPLSLPRIEFQFSGSSTGSTHYTDRAVLLLLLLLLLPLDGCQL